MNKNRIYTALFAIFALCPAVSTAQERTALSLDDCIALALENNILVRTAQLAEQQAVQKKREMFTAYFPTIGASGGIFDINEPLLNISIMGLPVQYMKSGNFAMLNATQPVFTGGRLVNGNKLARVGVDVSRIQHEQSIDEVRLTAEQYFWNVVVVKSKLETVAVLDTLIERLLKDVTAAVNAGVKMQNDLLTVQLKQNEVEAGRVKAENALEISRRLLAQYVGVDEADVDETLDVSEMPAFPAEIKKDHETALLTTTQYRLLQKNVEAKKLDRRLELGKHLPTVAVGAGLTTHNLLDDRANLAAVYATVSVPLTDWWGGSHAVKQTRYAQSIAEEQLEDNTKLLLISMDNRWNAVDEAYKQLAIAHKSVEQSRENLRLNDDYYRAGIIPLSDLLQAQSLFQQAADGYAQTYGDYRLAVSEYLVATASME